MSQYGEAMKWWASMEYEVRCALFERVTGKPIKDIKLDDIHLLYQRSLLTDPQPKLFTNLFNE